MKKLISLLAFLALVMSLLSTAAQAEDLTNWAYGFTAQCVSSNGLNHATAYHTKTSTKTYIQVRHSVIGNGSSGGYTNLMYGHDSTLGQYLGSKWQAPDGIYYNCTSSSFGIDHSITPGGRGNTKYNEQLGLTSVRLEGQFRVH